MDRSIARFNQRITFQKNTVTVDKYGNHKNTWSDVYSCFAYVSTWQKEETGNEVIHEERSVTFEVRYCSELADLSSDRYQIVFAGDAYNIQSVDYMNYQKSVIRLKAERTIRKVGGTGE